MEFRTLLETVKITDDSLDEIIDDYDAHISRHNGDENAALDCLMGSLVESMLEGNITSPMVLSVTMLRRLAQIRRAWKGTPEQTIDTVEFIKLLKGQRQ